MTVSSVNSGQIQAQAAKSAAQPTSLFGEIWDTINPFQHIPIVSQLYRAASGSDISAFANIAGSTIYGGPVGGAIAAVQEGVSAIGDAIFGEDEKATQVAAPTTTPPTALAAANPAKANSKPKLNSDTQTWMNKTLNEAGTQSNIAQPAQQRYNVLASTAEWLNGHASARASAAIA